MVAHKLRRLATLRKKTDAVLLFRYLCQMLTGFQNSFPVRFSRKSSNKFTDREPPKYSASFFSHGGPVARYNRATLYTVNIHVGLRVVSHTEVLNSRQNLVGEVPIRSHFSFPRRDADVCLVDAQSFLLHRMLVFHLVFLYHTQHRRISLPSVARLEVRKRGSSSPSNI